MRRFLILLLVCLAAAGGYAGAGQKDLLFGGPDKDAYALLSFSAPARGMNKQIAVGHEFSDDAPRQDAVWRAGSVLPGTPGIGMISMRGAAGDVLRDLRAGDRVRLEAPGGQKTAYEIEKFIVEQEAAELRVPFAEAESVLLLSACYDSANWQAERKVCFMAVAREKPGDKGMTS